MWGFLFSSREVQQVYVPSSVTLLARGPGADSVSVALSYRSFLREIELCAVA